MRKLITILFPLLLLSSCAGYVNSMYSQLDRDEAQVNKRNNPKADKFAFYRQKGRPLAGQESQEPAPLISTSERRVVDPAVKRQYVPATETKKRFKAEDLQDNTGSGSLWTGEGKDNSLFASKHEKQTGDIVVINVMANLKNDITTELKRAFPGEAPTPKPITPAAATTVEKTPPDKNTTAPGTEEEVSDQGKVYDKISSVIVEEINREHILLRGRKSLLFNSRKVTVEVQALVPRKGITEDDSVDSNSILESNVRVVR